MIPPTRTEQLVDFQNQLRRDEALSNLRALQQLQRLKGLAGNINPMTMQQPIIAMNEGGLVSLPVVHKFFGGGFNPFKPIKRIAKSIGKGIKGVGKGLSGLLKGAKGIFGGLKGGGLKNLIVPMALSFLTGGLPVLGAQTLGAWAPYVSKGIYSSMIPYISSGGKGKLIDLETGLKSGLMAYGMDQIGGMGAPKAGSPSYEGEGYEALTGGSGVPELSEMPPLDAMKDVSKSYSLSGGQGMSMTPYKAPVVPTTLAQAGVDVGGEIAADPTWYGQAKDWVGDKIIDPVREFAADAPSQTVVDWGKQIGAEPGFGTYGDIADAAVSGYEIGSGIQEREEQQEKIRRFIEEQELEAERRQMPTREWLKRLEDDPLQYAHLYKGDMSFDEIIRRALEGYPSEEDARQFETATWETPSGRESGDYALGARYGGYLPEIKKWFGGGTGVATPETRKILLGGALPQSGSGGFGGLAGLMNRPEVRKLFGDFTKVSAPVQPMPRTDNTGGTGPVIEKASGIQQIRQPSSFEKKGLMSQEEMDTYDNNMILLLEENEKAVARKEPTFTVMGETFKTNPTGAPIPVRSQRPTLALAGGGSPQQFFSGRVPNTVDPRSDGMSDSETMLITDPTGRDPRGIMKISEQEYVMSAPDMAILGNGDPVAGAQLMDDFRQNLRQAAYGTKAHQPRLNQRKALQSLAHKAFG